MRAASFFAAIVACVIGLSASQACTTLQPQTTTYFDQTIDPILQTSCVRTNTGAGCHVADPAGNAFGNLDLTSYAGLNRRRDLLLDYGPYLQPSLLVKNVPSYTVSVQLWDGTKVPVTTDIKHVGGSILDPTASGYETLRRWIENGAQENNTGNPPVNIPTEPCTHTIPSAPGFNGSMDPTSSDWGTFQTGAGPLLGNSCAFGNCHGSTVNALYLTCGSTAEETRWNYFAASNYLSTPPEQSEIVRRPLATSQGGSYHEGGPLFTSVQDPNYKTLLAWAQAAPVPTDTGLTPEFLFFAQKVQPVLVKKGCMMAQCHSAGMFHDYRLRGGSAGSFSLTASMRNYTFTVAQMSFESDDVNASRLVRKNLYRPVVYSGSNGITHRGGPLLEDFGGSEYTDGGVVDIEAGSVDAGSGSGEGGMGSSSGGGGMGAGNGLATMAACDAANYDYNNDAVDSIPPYCVIYHWYTLERAARMPAPLTGVVYVSKPLPTVSDRPQDFDVFQGGASLNIASVTPVVGTGQLTMGANNMIDPTACNIGTAPYDIRRPAVSWDGKLIAFAARTSSTPFSIYTMNADGSGCAKQPDIANHPASGNSFMEHDFDPAFSPPGPDGTERIVFASTRGNLDSSAVDYTGPQGTPEDVTKPNANLYVMEPDPNNQGSNRIRQLTFQLNMERLPSFMQDGRLVFTAEKREPGFYQLAARRQNLDGSDYHPLYAQRPSIGYTQATYVTELSHKDFAVVLSNQNALHGAGILGIANRSIWVDFTSPDAGDYLVTEQVPTVESDFFLHSLTELGTDGSYTSPAILPDGQLLVSYEAKDPSMCDGDYDVYVMDAVTGNKTKLLGTAGTAEIEAVPIMGRVTKGIFVGTPDEPNGHTYVDPSSTNADVTVLDMTVLASLLFQNTPTGRVVEPDLGSFDIYEDQPPDTTTPPACPSTGNLYCDAYGSVYVRRRKVGTVPIYPDGSARFLIPGGLPIVLHLADDSESQKMSLPRWQREEMTFVPGEIAHQSMPATFFNGLCAGCHSSISGLPVDSALNPDFITQASLVTAATNPAIDLTGPVSGRTPTTGPFTP